MSIIKKFILPLIALAVLIYIAVSLYEVACISCTIPPISEYEYKGSVNKLITDLKSTADQHGKMTIAITDTVGSADTGFAYDLDLNIKDDKSNNIKYDIRIENKDNSTVTNLSLIGAFNLTNNSGGYGKTAVGIDTLLKILNSEILMPLKIKSKEQ